MRQADDADFTAFVAASSRRLLRSAYLITGDIAAAEDLLQTALERAYRRWVLVRPRVSIFSMAGQGDGMWITTANLRGPTGTLIRLGDRLQPATPRSIRATPLFTAPQRVQTHGDTVWIVRSRQPYLACFAYHGQAGPVATIRTSHPPEQLAAAETVYVASSSWMASYRVPAACR